jgi:formimidoylglutamate deiminase
MQWERPTTVFARTALTAQGWQEDVAIGIGADGRIASVKANACPVSGDLAFDLVLPGISNVHSHAFQRSMAGLTEIASGQGKDNFWSWREVMYAFLRRLAPGDVEVGARALYIELLKHGYTAVGEFHYLHNDIDGKPYASATELSDRVIAAAQATGIHVTHLPVMYETANFGGIPAHEGQKRFVHTVDAFLELLETLSVRYGNAEGVTLGVAPHSLRAVTPESLRRIVDALPGFGLADCPIHMHVAEQEKEVSDCVAWSSRRPAEWLFDHQEINYRWCLIHATHTTEKEVQRIAKSGATIGFCPTTEANLGDGIFLAESYLRARGSFAIGSDSNVCVSPWEELRLMEYAQRLNARKRAALCTESTPSVGRTLFTAAATGGAKALGIRAGQIASGCRADLVALSRDHALLAEKAGDAILDTLIFAITPKITDVFVAGKRVIKNGTHALSD